MKNLLFYFLAITTTICFGQEEMPNQQSTDFKKEVTLDLKIHSSGYSVGVNYGLIRDKSVLFAHLSGSSIKHPKECKLSFDSPSTLGNPPRAFIYGKQNSFYTIKLGVGQKYNLSAVSKERGVTIGAAYHLGPSIGLLKPYYLELIRLIEGTTQYEVVTERITEENKSEFLDPFSIYGYGGFGYGIDEMKPVIGGYAQGSLRFEWGKQNYFIRAIETGLMIEAFPSIIPIMVEDEVKNNFLFANLFIAIQIGKRS